MALTGRKGQGPQKSTALPPETLRRTVDPASLGFDTTRSVTPASGLIGQDRALRAIQFGANIRQSDFNLFVLGPTGTGKTTAVKSHLSEKARREPGRSDWVYVNNFEDPDKPKAIALPRGSPGR